MNCANCHKPDAIYWKRENKWFCPDSTKCVKEFKSLHWQLENIPDGYRNTTLEKLPCQAATKALMDFEFCPEDYENRMNGCYLFGTTGSGKTRSAFLKILKDLENVFDSDGVIWIRGSQFAREVVNRTKPGGIGGFDEWFSSLLEAELLVIDEVDKIKFSERVMSEFFDLIEHRTSHFEAMMLISNSGVSTLCAKMPDESGPAIARRIKETLVPIKFFV